MEWWNDLISQNYDWFWDVSIALGITLSAGLGWRITRRHIARLAAKPATVGTMS